MGVVSGAALEWGGKVTGIVPFAMVKSGGEGEKVKSDIHVDLEEVGREKVRLTCYALWEAFGRNIDSGFIHCVD